MSPRQLELVTDTALADDLAIELALSSVDVHVVPPAVRGEAADGGTFALDVSAVQTLIVTVSTTTTAVLTLAKTILDIVKKHNENAQTPSGALTITGDNNVVILGDAPDAMERLVAVLERPEAGQIRIERPPGD